MRSFSSSIVGVLQGEVILLGLSAIVTLLVGGCQQAPQSKVAPVSGTVYLDGQPVENVKVLFVPIDRGISGNEGPIAFAVTDANGKYTLAHREGGNGAAVGRNQVWLTTRRVEKKKDEEGVAQTVETKEELIPPRYNKSTELVFDVSAEGTDKADFDLRSDPEP